MEVPAGGSEDGYAARVARHGAVATALALHSDRRLLRLVTRAPVVRSGIGGTAHAVDIEGSPVFVKRVPITDLELRPEHRMSTANLFGLPTFFQYGVGSAGFGAWRELAAHAMTTAWVLGGRCASFPLLYHWRVLPGAAPPPPPDHPELERAVAFWAGSPAVRARLAALARSSASLVLFLEHVPYNLDEWLISQAAAGPEALAAACSMAEHDLRAATSFMNDNGLFHFDAHFWNVLTDGARLYLADFGLATSPRFELSDVEARFLHDHASYDPCLALTGLVNWLVARVVGVADPAQRNAYLRRCATGTRADGPPAVAAVIERHAPVAAVLNDFHWRLHRDSRTTPYPAAEVDRAHAGLSRPVPHPGGTVAP
jgi:hypothetical protein